jgi:hypothetical protein
MGEEFPQGVRHIPCVSCEIIDLGGSLSFHWTGVQEIEGQLLEVRE